MRTLFPSLAAATLLLAPFVASTAADAALPVGAHAPAFVTTGAKGGKPVRFDLEKALKKGPVVLYFYPKAFTQGCTLEAHAFAAAADDFHKLGATVVGMSGDDLPTLEKFSTEACRSKFPVAMATPKIVHEYDVKMDRPGVPANMTNRVSYVIARDGTITMVHSDLDYRDHVKLTLAAVKKLEAAQHH